MAKLVLPGSLRFQLLSRSLFILAALLVLIGAFQYVIMKDFIYKNQAEKMASQMRGPLREVFDRSGQTPEHWGGDGQRPAPAGPAPEPGPETKNVPEPRPLLFLPDSSLAIINSDYKFIDLASETGITAPRLTDSEYGKLFNRNWGKSRPGEYRVMKDGEGNEQLVVFREVVFPGDNGEQAWLVQMGIYTAPMLKVVFRQLLTFAGLPCSR
ncbi:hypothetical protein HMSSN036_86860 [Paenibacillus macerans]|nr:hypothetical protein HMSSN036_86860 [Paenibacillus macerans]